MLKEKLNPENNSKPKLINFDKIIKKDNDEKEENEPKNILNNNTKSIQDKISEKIGSIKSFLKKERIGTIYCIIAQFFWTLNNVILKFITRNYKNKFTNRSYLISRGIAIIILSYICGMHFDKKIYKLTDFEPQMRKCLLIRANLSFFGMCFWLLAVYYLRISTCQIIVSLSPIFQIFLGVFFLNEKFYHRYIFGVILGVVGSSIIILNENKITNEKKKDNNSSLSDVALGLLSMAANITITGIIQVVNKIMATKKISPRGREVGCAE